MDIKHREKCVRSVNTCKTAKPTRQNCGTVIIRQEQHFPEFLLVGFDILSTNQLLKKVDIKEKSCTPLGGRTFLKRCGSITMSTISPRTGRNSEPVW